MSVEIPLLRRDGSVRGIAVVDDEDADLVDLRWHMVQHSAGPQYTSYAKSSIGAEGYILMHRLILERCMGRELTETEVSDHVNGDGLDNRRKNLRVATRSQNGANRRVRHNKTSQYLGVYKRENGKWRVSMTCDGVGMKFGNFDSEEAAALAYNAAAIQRHGEFARLNEVGMVEA